jgi:hypothetical protein
MLQAELPGRRRLLRQTRTIQRIEFTAVTQIRRHDIADIFWRAARACPLEGHNTDWACRVHPWVISIRTSACSTAAHSIRKPNATRNACFIYLPYPGGKPAII